MDLRNKLPLLNSTSNGLNFLDNLYWSEAEQNISTKYKIKIFQSLPLSLDKSCCVSTPLLILPGCEGN